MRWNLLEDSCFADFSRKHSGDIPLCSKASLEFSCRWGAFCHVTDEIYEVLCSLFLPHWHVDLLSPYWGYSGAGGSKDDGGSFPRGMTRRAPSGVKGMESVRTGKSLLIPSLSPEKEPFESSTSQVRDPPPHFNKLLPNHPFVNVQDLSVTWAHLQKGTARSHDLGFCTKPSFLSLVICKPSCRRGMISFQFNKHFFLSQKYFLLLFNASQDSE